MGFGYIVGTYDAENQVFSAQPENILIIVPDFTNKITHAFWQKTKNGRRSL